jgi:hypothetical protein
MAGTDEEAMVMQMVEPGRPSGRSGSPLIFIAPSFLSTYRLIDLPVSIKTFRNE